jgi:hypothetical protein
MELLLNLAWLILAVGSLFAFVRSRRRSARMAHVAYGTALIALACVVVLLFPIVSASDDLHPTQAVVEDASKKLQLAIAPLHLLRTIPPLFMLPATLTLCLFTPALVRAFRPAALTARVLDGAIVPSAGRAPPSCCN